MLGKKKKNKQPVRMLKKMDKVCHFFHSRTMLFHKQILRGGPVVSRQPHKLEFEGSTPSPATKIKACVSALRVPHKNLLMSSEKQDVGLA